VFDFSRQFSGDEKYGKLFRFPAALKKPRFFNRICGQDCVQGPPQHSKALISNGILSALKFVAASPAGPFLCYLRFPHTFCGQDCVQACRTLVNPLIPNGKTRPPKYCARARFPQFSASNQWKCGISVLFFTPPWMTCPGLHTNCGKGCEQG
jgi:hypothetical protein